MKQSAATLSTILLIGFSLLVVPARLTHGVKKKFLALIWAGGQETVVSGVGQRDQITFRSFFCVSYIVTKHSALSPHLRYRQKQPARYWCDSVPSGPSTCPTNW